MKKIFLWLGLVIFLSLPIAAYAASIGGAETVGQGKWAIGLDQEFVFDRDMKLNTSPTVSSGSTLKWEPEIDKMYRAMVKVSYGMRDNWDVYLKLGAVDFDTEENWEITNTTTGQWAKKGVVKRKSDHAFAYGLGMKGKYELKNDWIIGYALQYLEYKNDFKGTNSAEKSNGDTWEDKLKGKADSKAWHVAPYIAKKMGSFMPYLGVKYSDLRTKYKTEWYDNTGGESDSEDKIRFKTNDSVGVFLGADYKLAENYILNLEGRFIDESALSVGGTYKF